MSGDTTGGVSGPKKWKALALSGGGERRRDRLEAHPGIWLRLAARVV
jgi:hypothetical protein